MIITLDGPAGSGKSTVARLLAAQLGFEFLDTGAMYRAVAWKCLQQNANFDDEATATTVARNLELKFTDNRLFCDGVDITQAIREPMISQNASRVAVHPGVREQLVELQRRTAQGKDFVTEGRDQGTVVFPNAECKFFLTASVEQRALRRQQDLIEAGQQVNLEELTREIRERDDRDSSREVAPLQAAEDAVTIDTTDFSLEEVLAQLQAIINTRRNP